MPKSELENFRQLFADNSVYSTVGIVERVSVPVDRSMVFVECQLAFEDRKVIARMTWDNLGNECGVIMLPEPLDTVILEFTDGDPDHCFVTARVPSEEEKIPLQALDGNLMVIAPFLRKIFLQSDTKVSISGTGDEASEPMVLGNVLATMLGSLIDTLVGSGVFSFPVNTQLTLLKTLYLTVPATNILSQVGYVDRGGL